MFVLQAERAPEWIQTWLTSEVGLMVLFGLCILEGAMLLRFMPSELVVPAALALMGTSFSIVVTVIAIAVVGTTIGQVILFLVVRRGGREYILKRGWVPISESQLDRFDVWFQRWGMIAVPVSNTMLFVRGLLTFPAGLSDMKPRTFLVLSALGSLSFQTILAGLYIYAEKLLV
jgi:membrane protein DedA with SNARE-associated domain